MRLLTLLLLLLAGCEEKEEDHAILDEIVLADKDDEDLPLVIDPSVASQESSNQAP